MQNTILDSLVLISIEWESYRDVYSCMYAHSGSSISSIHEEQGKQLSETLDRSCFHDFLHVRLNHLLMTVFSYLKVHKSKNSLFELSKSTNLIAFGMGKAPNSLDQCFHLTKLWIFKNFRFCNLKSLFT